MELIERLNRKVYFFRVADSAEFLPRLESAFQAIEELPFNENGRYQATGSDETVLAVYIKSTSYPISFQFARIRRDNLPVIEKGGDVKHLQLEDKEGLMDCSHISIFADGIVAAEFNNDAPRIRRLGGYLFMKSSSSLPSAPRFMPLFQKDVLGELASLPAITVLEVEAKTSEADLVAEGNAHIGAALQACKMAGSVKRSTLELRSGSSGSTLRQVAQNLFSNSASREALTRLKVWGGAGRQRRSLDLLEEYLVSTEGFLKDDPRSKAISSDDAFTVLAESYRKNLSKFASAAVGNEIW